MKSDKENKIISPGVSVIIPVYNAGNCIRRCLDSVCGQTFQELEILCIDDCSTDDSVEKIEQAAAEDSRIRLIKSEKNTGAGPVRNKGIELARGKYFFFLDADDFLNLLAIEELYSHAEKHGLELCFCGHAVYDETDNTIKRGPHTTEIFLKRYEDRVFSWEEVQRFLYQNIFCVPWNRLYLTEFVRKSPVRFPVLENSEDFFFGEAIVTLARRMGTVWQDEPSVYYRVGRQGQISSTVARNPYCMLESVRLLYDFLKETNMLEGVKKSYHSIVLEALFFAASFAENPKLFMRDMAQREFPRVGMSGLKRDDFINTVIYRNYRECRPIWQDTCGAGIKEDPEKCRKIRDFLDRHRKETTVLWGVGMKGRTLLQELKRTGHGFAYGIDMDPKKAGRSVDGMAVFRYEEMPEPPDHIMLTNAGYFAEIYRLCKDKNPSCRIIDLDTFFRCDMTIEECMA